MLGQGIKAPHHWRPFNVISNAMMLNSNEMVGRISSMV